MAPIRKEWLKFYRGPGWQAVRARILRRAGGRFDADGSYQGGARCESCQAPDRTKVIAASGYLYTALKREPLMLWRPAWGDEGWRTHRGQWVPELPGLLKGAPDPRSRVRVGSTRVVLVQLGIAHVNHRPGEDGDDNLRAWCRWCHLHHDRPFHKETRSRHKDLGRPLLEACAAAVARASEGGV